MTLQEIENALKKAEMPVAYNHFEVKKKPPYCVYYETESNYVKADNTHYCDIVGINIELYYTHKDKSIEKKIEAILDEMELVYNKQEIFIEEEKIYMMIYETEVLLNE